MRVIGVIDLRGTQAVHARAGLRDLYEPIGDAVDLARTYIDRYGIDEIYIADLDAIADAGRPALRTVGDIIDAGAAVWLDAGIFTVDRAREALALGASRVIVGLETLPSFGALRDICGEIGGPRVAFSLDLHDGTPIGIARHEHPGIVAARAADNGAGAIIVLDVARVGMRGGPDMELIAQVRDAAPSVTLVAGGGVRGQEDLERLAGAGCDGALVATALHDGNWRP